MAVLPVVQGTVLAGMQLPSAWQHDTDEVEKTAAHGPRLTLGVTKWLPSCSH